MSDEVIAVHELKDRCVTSSQHDFGSDACLERLLPASHAEAPFVSGFEARKLILPARSDEVISSLE